MSDMSSLFNFKLYCVLQYNGKSHDVDSGGAQNIFCPSWLPLKNILWGLEPESDFFFFIKSIFKGICMNFKRVFFLLFWQLYNQKVPLPQSSRGGGGAH